MPDYEKAFDTVKKHYKKKIRTLQYQKCITWFKQLYLSNFLSNTQQFISPEEQKSDLETIYYRVPQGSNLEPLMFLIYINDIPYSITYNVRLFADDICSFFSMLQIQCYKNKKQM